MIARELFQGNGFEVLEAKTGDEAIGMLDKLDHLDLVFTDVRMPGRHDGIDVAYHAQSRFPRVPVIIATGYAANIQERLQRCSPRAVLINKPYRLDQLAKLAWSLCGGGNDDR